MSVKIEKDGMVEDLHDAIIKKAGITDESQLYKVNLLSTLSSNDGLISLEATSTRYCCGTSGRSICKGGVANIKQR